MWKVAQNPKCVSFNVAKRLQQAIREGSPKWATHQQLPISSPVGENVPNVATVHSARQTPFITISAPGVDDVINVTSSIINCSIRERNSNTSRSFVVIRFAAAAPALSTGTYFFSHLQSHYFRSVTITTESGLNTCAQPLTSHTLHLILILTLLLNSKLKWTLN